MFLEISQNSQECTCVRVSFLITLQDETWNFVKKETLVQVLSYEFCEISKNICSYRTFSVAASDWQTTASQSNSMSFLQLFKLRWIYRTIKKLKSSVTSKDSVMEKNVWLSLQIIKKGTLAQGFSCDFWKIFKNTFFHRTPPVAAFEKAKRVTKWS